LGDVLVLLWPVDAVLGAIHDLRHLNLGHDCGTLDLEEGVSDAVSHYVIDVEEDLGG